MSFQSLTLSFPWQRYSKALKAHILSPQHGGILTSVDGLRLVEGVDGDIAEGNVVHLYWHVDPANGVIIDAKFQVFGQSALIGAAEAACALIIHKNYDQARRIPSYLIDKELRDKGEGAAFPPETNDHLNLVVGAIENAAGWCDGIPLAESYIAPMAPQNIGEVLEGGYPGFDEMTLKQKVALIEEVLDREVRPYIALDGGGVDLIEMVGNREVIISYKGNCTSCFSSTGATLSYIQQVLCAKVHPDMQVTPHL